MAEKIVQVDHITKKYKECTVLDDVSLSIRIGDVIGLVGGNGAGKTTLMRAIAGSIPVDSGEIIFSGVWDWRVGRKKTPQKICGVSYVDFIISSLSRLLLPY